MWARPRQQWCSRCPLLHRQRLRCCWQSGCRRSGPLLLHHLEGVVWRVLAYICRRGGGVTCDQKQVSTECFVAGSTWQDTKCSPFVIGNGETQRFLRWRRKEKAISKENKEGGTRYRRKCPLFFALQCRLRQNRRPEHWYCWSAGAIDVLGAVPPHAQQPLVRPPGAS